ncbi:MAG: hypothetical protein IJZ53_02545 [Tyzzerella sp.]|nr:hypothetical protein [Tyzzerella sp.]
MEYTKRFIYQSNQWYNDGLKKANIRDMSGAIASLKKSLQYNRDNIAARNLLGLVYYGRGEVVEALVEWVISKNIKTHGNIANYYIKKVQETQSELEAINQAIKKYNQCLVYCQQGGEDLAAIQLKKVIAAHPTFLRAHQLLALLYIQTEQYAKARQLIRKAHKLDTTNEITLRYMHELKQLHKDKAAKLKEDKAQTVSYKLGNETIIQPVSATLKDNATLITILNIVIGLAVGAAVVWFLAVPTMKQNMSAKTNKDIIVYSEQIAALESEIDLMKRDLDAYAAESEATAAEKEIAAGTSASYEALVAVIEHYHQAGYKRSTLVDEILAVNTASLGETGRATYDKISQEVFGAECQELYATATTSYAANGFKRAAESLERIMQMDEKYADGQAILLLMQTYQKQGDAEKANAKYQRILELLPETQVAKDAAALMTGQAGQ